MKPIKVRRTTAQDVPSLAALLEGLAEWFTPDSRRMLIIARKQEEGVE